jgi:predicted transcriptional regulator
MSEVLTVELPDDLAREARALAVATNRRLEDAVLDWVRQAIAEPAVESLADEALLEFCNLRLEETQQEELSDLLARGQEGKLGPQDRARLDELMAVYRRGLKLKARALKEATSRGLRPPLSDDAA